ncbi:hypothetical protein MFIFM68171_08220 [Madurella fahalii]|uniref:Uncharacterized protein n=1 Tax=Madurella fahalii TaxID=1157608 RepID=A0ABQ0GJX9_9PEZI
MPSSIPYDPSLVLGSIVKKETIESVVKISQAQAGPDAAQNHLNSLLATKRSLDMTRTELRQLGIPDTDDSMKELNAEIQQLDKDVAAAAVSYCREKIAAEKAIQDLRKNMSMVHDEYESPVDYVKTQIKTMPLAADSMNMDVQYFSRDENSQDASTYANNISSFVSASTNWLGKSVSSSMTEAAQKQATQQTSKHSISGTLVLSVTCTHKNAAIMAPLILNVDKAVKAWNHFYGKTDKLVPTDGASMMKLANQDDPDTDGSGDNINKFSIISGMTFGSSFVGMVHVLNTTDTNVSESLSTLASSLQAQMDAGGWFAKASGGFGVSASFSNSVKNLLSTQNISSHVTLICMGTIPSMVASEVKMGVEKFAQFDPKTSMDTIATIQNATVADQGSVTQAADAARTGGQMVTMKASEIKSALSALAEIDDGSNKILDVNSMMTALDDYLKKASEGSSGVPINYYLKDITKGMLAEMWVAKYYPGKYMKIQWDDSGNGGGGGGGGGGGEGGGGEGGA